MPTQTPFLDTSAFTRLFVDLPDHQRVRRLLRNRSVIAVSRITYAETAAALARMWREQNLDEEQFDELLQKLDVAFPEYRIVESDELLVRRVPALVRRNRLRGFDAVQLASALLTREEGATVEFWTADGPLASASRNEGLKTIQLG